MSSFITFPPVTVGLNTITVSLHSMSNLSEIERWRSGVDFTCEHRLYVTAEASVTDSNGRHLCDHYCSINVTRDYRNFSATAEYSELLQSALDYSQQLEVLS